MPSATVRRKPAPHAIGINARVGQFLSQHYAGLPAKVLAADVSVSERKALDLLSGVSVLPHIEQLASMFGAPFVRFVFQDATTRAETLAQLDQVEREIQAIEADIAKLEHRPATFQRPMRAECNEASDRGGVALASQALRDALEGRRPVARRPGPLLAGRARSAHPRWPVVAGLLRQVCAVGA